MLKQGDVAPEFTVQDSVGKTHRLSDYRGKNVVLWFYPKADTPGCTAEGCSFRDHKTQYEAKGTVILGISFDTPEENQAFSQKFGFNFPLLSDVDRKVGLAYGAADDASAANARRVGVVIGPDGRIKEWHAKVDARAFPQEALSRLQ
ncbi:peroxiredoxin [Corallococcus carmarthensis]|uniref:thioredoxin-dependent peroxiredoxin n=1 Tax=Corallococcus carmarthensis TaxID=2316728 RepID=A0A3A8K8Y5_9BACT|nr:peroxiredoxin [Corallococcus carmarthensis]NOK19436.1 peroxiredoxin [Corallococcus carmarthensis]RKH04658.1 peroxiredoxin [Corallococcus carmarthensis]